MGHRSSRKYQRGRGEYKKTTHHIIPTSRGGRDDAFNKIYPPQYKHVYYHILFENWTPDEILSKLNDYWSNLNRNLAGHFDKQINSYKALFGDMKPREVKQYLKEHWFNASTSQYKKHDKKKKGR